MHSLLRLSKKWHCHFFDKASLRSAPLLSADSGQFDAHSAQSVFCHAHVAAENKLYCFRVCGRETLRGFFDILTFLEQTFGAAAAIAICAGGLMGLPQTVSGLREMKILKRFRVTPVSPVFVLGVELSMYIVYCIVSLATLAAAALLWGVRLRGSLPAFLGSWALTMLSTLSIGMLVGGVAKDIKQASVIASILYFPMLIFSGTTLPVEVMPPVMQRIVSFFPLTQGITMMKNAFLGVGAGSVLTPVCVMLGLTALCAVLSVRFFRWE